MEGPTKTFYQLDAATQEQARDHFVEVIVDEMLSGRFAWEQLGSRRGMIQARVSQIRQHGTRPTQADTLLADYNADLRRLAQIYAQQARYLETGERAVSLRDLTQAT